MIITENVEKGFPLGDGNIFTALTNVNIEVPEHALTVLKGRSGSGKTTLMNILGALDLPTSGRVLFDGTDLTAVTEKERELLRRRSIGYVFQAVALIPMMTAFENVDYALRLANYQGDRNARVRECLSLVGLSERTAHFPQEMSGGEQQRVAIARAIAHKPKVIFADEPTGELDSQTGLQVMKILKELISAEGATIVITTHDPKLMEVGDAVYELKDGKAERQ